MCSEMKEILYNWPFNSMGLNSLGPLYVHFFPLVNTSALHDLGLAEPLILRHHVRRKGQLEVISGFFSAAESAPITPVLFKGQLCYKEISYHSKMV